MFEILPPWAPWAAGWLVLVSLALAVVGVLRIFGVLDENKARWAIIVLGALTVVGPLLALLALPFRNSRDSGADESNEDESYTETEGVTYDNNVEDILDDVSTNSADSDGDVDVSSDDPADWRL